MTLSLTRRGRDVMASLRETVQSASRATVTLPLTEPLLERTAPQSNTLAQPTQQLSILDATRTPDTITGLITTIDASVMTPDGGIPVITQDLTATVKTADYSTFSPTDITSALASSKNRRFLTGAEYSFQLRHQSDLEQTLITQTMPGVLDALVGTMLLTGDGGTEEPQGLQTHPDIDDLSLDGALTIDHLAEMEEALGASITERAGARIAFVTNAKVRRYGRITPRFSGASTPLWTDINTMGGRPAVVHGSIPTDLGSGAQSGLYIADWARAAALVLYRPTLDLVFDRVTKAPKGIMSVFATLYADVVVTDAAAIRRTLDITTTFT